MTDHWSVCMRGVHVQTKRYGIDMFWCAATSFVGHSPWFGTYGHLDETLPVPMTVCAKFLCQASSASSRRSCRTSFQTPSEL